MDGRRIECARGKVVGGSSAINAMAYYHGHRSDYDRWAANRLPAMVLCACVAVFPAPGNLGGRRRHLSRRRRSADHAILTFEDPMCQAFMAAGKGAGHPVTDDYNGARQEGFAPIQMTLRNGRRCSAATAYLRPAMTRPNLTVEVHALAARIVMEGTARDQRRVYATRPDRKQRTRSARSSSPAARSTRRSCSCCRASASPKLESSRHRAAHSAQGRGQRPSGPHLRCDHVPPQGSRSVPPQHAARPRRIRTRAGLCPRKGFATDLPFGITAFLKTRPRRQSPTSRCCSGWAPPTPRHLICGRSRSRSLTASHAGSCRCGRQPRPCRARLRRSRGAHADSPEFSCHRGRMACHARRPAHGP